MMNKVLNKKHEEVFYNPELCVFFKVLSTTEAKSKTRFFIYSFTLSEENPSPDIVEVSKASYNAEKKVLPDPVELTVSSPEEMLDCIMLFNAKARESLRPLAEILEMSGTNIPKYLLEDADLK